MKKQPKNTLWAIAQHLVAVLCGLILPREILAHYGSEMNGLVHSVSRFLSYTVLLELGIGAVIPASLYQPLLDGDSRKISAIIRSGYGVFHRIAAISGVYMLLLMLVYTTLTARQIPRDTTAMLIFILGLRTVASYTFGVPERLLLISDQKGYIVYAVSYGATILNTALQVALIRSGSTLPAVKLVATSVSILQISLIYIYVRHHYRIERRIRYEGEPIPQKWNGIAQHVAYFVLENTDILLLTVFSTLREVSVYSVYFMVISGVRRIFSSISYSIQPKLGELKARGDAEALNRFFSSFERWIHVSTSLAYCLLGLLLVPFVQAYTEGVTDANYSRPLFALLMSLAYGFQSIRDPYDKLILASGHFKQTQHSYIIAACLNFGISVLTVRRWGLEGVAFGTLVAMMYQTVYMALYDSGKLLARSITVFFRNISLDVLIVISIVLVMRCVHFPAAALFDWLFSLIRL